jgi:mono/diheme cytochrome c family protein
MLHATSSRDAPNAQGLGGPANIRMRSLARLNAVAFLLLYSVVGVPVRADETSKGAVLERGQHIAELVCSACHVVEHDQEFPPILRPPAPSFDEIANRSGVTVQTVRQFVSQTHWDLKTLPMQMPDPMLSTSDASAVARYVLSLRRQ